MRLKLICCDVFARLAYLTAAKSPHVVDLEFLPMLAHNEPDRLRQDLQAAIDNIDKSAGYDKIILAYGLCGNAVVGLKSPIPLIIPRMHDCSAMFLGSREKFMQIFGHRLSTRWRSCGYMERCPVEIYKDYKLHPDYIRMVEEYGEDNAEYIWETMNPPVETDQTVYIELEGFEYGDMRQRYIEQMAIEDCEVEIVIGDTKWFVLLVNGPWDKKDFFELTPGNTIESTYDMEEIFR